MTKESWKKPIVLLTYGLVLFFLLYHFSDMLGILGVFLGILTPFLFGGALAFILNIPMSFFERNVFRWEKHPKLKKLRRTASLILTLICAVAVVFLVIFLVVPELVHTVSLIVEQIPKSLATFEAWISTLDVDWELVQANVLGEDFDIQALSEKVAAVAQGVLPSVFSSAFSVVSSTVGVVTNVVIGFIFSIYLLVSKEKLGIQAKKFVYAFLDEKKADRIVYICSLSHKTFKSFITGQCLEAVILGTMFIVVMTIARLPYALLVGVVIMVTALIPIVGAFIGCVVGAFLILIVSPIQALEFVILFLVLQQVEGNLIYPHVVGSSVGLPSIWVLVSVTVGGGLMGVIGMLLFIPLVSVIYTLLREEMYEKLGEKGVPAKKWKAKD